MARLHAICCQKGGVGKTTITVNLAATVNDVLGGDGDETPVLVVSTDPQRSMDWWADRVGDDIPFGYDTAFDAKKVAALQRVNGYEHVFIDTPGSLENGHILDQVLEIADDAVVPITTEPLSFVPVDTTIERLIKPRNMKYTVVVNDWDPRDGAADLDQTRDFVAAKKWSAANTVIRHYKVHARAAADGTVCTQYPKNRVSMEARQDFLRLALELGYGGR